MITIRKAEAKDKNEILQIMSSLYVKMPDFVWNSNEFVEKQIASNEYFVAENEAEIVGAISLRKRKNKISIETLMVKESFRLNGVGSSLVDFAKSFTKENKFNILHVYSFYEYNSVDFYTKLGFTLLKKPGEYKGYKYHCFEIKVN